VLSARRIANEVALRESRAGEGRLRFLISEAKKPAAGHMALLFELSTYSRRTRRVAAIGYTISNGVISQNIPREAPRHDLGVGG